MSAGHPTSRTLWSSATALFLIQLFTLALPLMLTPFYARTLSTNGLGIALLGFSLMSILNLLADFGFTLFGVKEIAGAHHGADINRISSTLQWAKLAISALLVTATLLILFGSGGGDFANFFLVLSISTVAQGVQPVWFFQAMGKLVGFLLIVGVGRTLYATLAFTTITGDSHLNLLAAWYSACTIAISIGALTIAQRQGGRMLRPELGNILDSIRKSTHFFIARASASLYSSGGTVLLGLMHPPATIVPFAVLEQLYRGALSLLATIPQALYPHMLRTKDFTLLRRLLLVTSILGSSGAIGFLLFGPTLLTLYAGPDVAQHTPLLLVLVFPVALTIAFLSSLTGYPGLGAIGHTSLANTSVIAGSIGYATVVLILMVGGSFTMSSAVLSLALTELAILGMRAVWLRRALRTAHPGSA